MPPKQQDKPKYTLRSDQFGGQIVPFYGHSPKAGSKRIFSNFYQHDTKKTLSPMTLYYLKGQRFHSSEQGMMWEKAQLFGDRERAQLILEATDPMECKNLGRQVTPFDSHVWSQQCRQLVFQHLAAKFCPRQNPDLHRFLIETTGLLVEAAPRDTIWGAGLGQTPTIYDQSQWRGSNWLGELLTILRERFLDHPVAYPVPLVLAQVPRSDDLDDIDDIDDLDDLDDLDK